MQKALQQFFPASSHLTITFYLDENQEITDLVPWSINLNSPHDSKWLHIPLTIVNEYPYTHRGCLQINNTYEKEFKLCALQQR